MLLRRIHVFYSGYVQGVGFRYTVRNIALELGLIGWVRNLRDGSVEAVCEGDEKKLKLFLDRVEDNFPTKYIKGKDVTWEDPTQEFDGFGIRF